MKQDSYIAACIAGLAALCCASVNALPAEETVASRTQPDHDSKWLFHSRARLEHWQHDNASPTATANTLRTRLGYKMREIEGFAALLEVQDVRVSDDSYGVTAEGGVRRSPFADLEGTNINRAYISYAGMFDTAFTYGRQRLILDSARAVGDPDWQQHELTFDAFKVENTTFTDTKITLAYVDKVHGVFGANSEHGDVAMQSPLINVAYKRSPVFDISGYGYFLSFDNNPAASRQTSGIRVKGEYPLRRVELLYAAEYARQSDYKDGMADINADYRHLVAGLRFAALTTEIGFETLSGDGEYAFQTPLATGQAFNGWADQFLVTPLNGLTDVYVSADTSFAGMRWKAVYHDFSADRGGVDYGNELNLLIVKNFSRRYTLGVKYANYFANDFSVDTEKIQIYAEISI